MCLRLPPSSPHGTHVAEIRGSTERSIALPCHGTVYVSHHRTGTAVRWWCSESGAPQPELEKALASASTRSIPWTVANPRNGGQLSVNFSNISTTIRVFRKPLLPPTLGTGRDQDVSQGTHKAENDQLTKVIQAEGWLAVPQ